MHHRNQWEVGGSRVWPHLLALPRRAEHRRGETSDKSRPHQGIVSQGRTAQRFPITKQHNRPRLVSVYLKRLRGHQQMAAQQGEGRADNPNDPS
eukprot:369733-Amphidinium_carterae.1